MTEHEKKKIKQVKIWPENVKLVSDFMEGRTKFRNTTFTHAMNHVLHDALTNGIRVPEHPLSE